MNKSIRFTLDQDNDIIDNEKINVYNKNSQKDWERLLMLLNTLEKQKKTNENKYNNLIETLKEEYQEYNNNYIDEYNLIKVDIMEDLLTKLGIKV